MHILHPIRKESLSEDNELFFKEVEKYIVKGWGDVINMWTWALHIRMLIFFFFSLSFFFLFILFFSSYI